VTVVMATYNWATVLPFSIGSVLDQTFTDFELVVVGDGCTDESADVVEAVGDRRVRWHNLRANTGHQAGPNNEGIAMANSGVIAYLGHDDLWLPRHLELLLGAIDEGARVAHGTSLFVLPDRRPVAAPTHPWRDEPGAWIAPTTLMHERSLVDEVGGWRYPRDTGALDPDTEFFQRLGRASPPQWVPSLTSVKLPAARRRDVYRDRPHHEQAYWARRIRQADDAERELRAACGERYRYAMPRWQSEPKRLTEALRARVHVRSWLRSRGLLPAALEVTPATAEDRRRAWRRYKGLGDD
jgi:glycosyltransferase involved in cell wall biosynthesis